jgi:hypothetical protein
VRDAACERVARHDAVLDATLLRYDASEHGWNAAAFHDKVDNMGPAFLIAKTTNGGYFGAFNPVGWASREDYRDCYGAFLVKWPKPGSTKEQPLILPKQGGPGARSSTSARRSHLRRGCSEDPARPRALHGQQLRAVGRRGFVRRGEGGQDRQESAGRVLLAGGRDTVFVRRRRMV